MAALDEFLERQYQALGVRPSRFQRRKRGGRPALPTPEATRDLPEGKRLESLFQESVVADQMGEQTSIMETLLAPVKALANVFSAGEYAVASAIRAAVATDRKWQFDNPFTAFMKGIAAGFQDESKYQTTMYDVLSDLGWDADDTGEEIGKHVLGFGLGMLLDPLTYVGFGAAARSAKFTPKAVKAAVAKIGVPLDKIGQAVRGVYAGKHGKKFISVLEDLHGKALKESAAGAVETADILDFARKAVPVEASARKDFLHGILPFTDDITKKTVTIGTEEVNLVDKALEVLKDAGFSEASGKGAQEWYLKEGWKKMLDRGGLKLGIPFTGIEGTLLSGKVMGPRTSGLYGLMVGSMAKDNIPLTDKLVERVSDSKLWKRLVSDPFWGTVNKFNEKFRAKAGLDLTDQALRSRWMGADAHFRKTAQYMAEALDAVDTQLVDEKMGVPVTEALLSGDLTPAKKGIDYLTGQERILQEQMLYDATSVYRITPDTWDNFVDEMLLRKPDKNFLHTAKHGIGKDGKGVTGWKSMAVNEVLAERMKQTGKRKLSFFQALTEFDEILSEEKLYDPMLSYFPSVPGQKFKGAPGEEAINIPADITAFPNTLHRQVLGRRFHDVMGLPLGKGRGQILAKPTLDVRDAVMTRIAASYRQYMYGDAGQFTVTTVGKHAALATGPTGAKYDKSLVETLADSKLRAEHPGLLKDIADRSLGRERGLSQAGTEVAKGYTSDTKWFNELDRMGVLIAGKKMDPDDLLGHVIDFQPSKFMTDDNIEHLMTRYQEKINHFDNLGNHKAAQTLQDLEDFFRERLTDGHVSNVVEQHSKVAREGIQAAEEELASKTAQGASQDELLQSLQRSKDSQGYQDLVNETSTLLEEVEKDLSDKGLEKFLPALLEKEGAASAEELSVGALGRLRDRLKEVKGLGQAGRDRALEDLLTPATDLIQPTAPAWKKIPVRSPGSSTVDSTMADYAYPVPLAREISRVMDPTYVAREQGGTWLRGIDFVTNPLKKWLTGTTIAGVLRPAFFGRNALDLLFRRGAAMTTIAGAPNPQITHAAYKILRGGPHLLDEVILNGEKFTVRELKESFVRDGLWHHQWGRIGAGDWAPVEAILDKFTDVWGTNYRAIKERLGSAINDVLKVPWKGEVIGSGMENFGIIESMLGQLNRGEGWTRALNNTSKHLFDYSNLTPFEKQLSRLFLFYNFQRQALPWALSTLSSRPFVFGKLGNFKGWEGLTRDEKAAIPKWIKDYPFVAMKSDGKTLSVASMRNVFTVDVLMDTPTDLNQVIQKMNPLLMAPIEYALGREIFMQRDIFPVKTLRREYNRGAIEAVGPGGFPLPLSHINWLKAREVTLSNGQKATAVDGHRWFLMRKLWFSRMFRDMDQVGKAFSGDTGFVEGFMNFGLGVKMADYDIDKQQDFLQAEARKLKSSYDRARRSGDRQRANEILRQAGGLR
jgi:hypothetical protein